MPIRVEVYTSGGMASGLLARPGALRDVLASDEQLQLDDTVWQALDDTAPHPAGTLRLPVDDILLAIADEEPGVPVHAAWHHVTIDSGPYALQGELATMPGFDPSRSLTRPSGAFVLLREVRLSLRDRPEAGVAAGDHALVNRYAVERIEADLMLGFFFPGAEMVTRDERPAGAPQAIFGAA